MRKKIIFLLLSSLLIGSLTACGKSQQDRDAETLAKELGMSTSDAKEFMDAVNDDSSKSKTSSTTESESIDLPEPTYEFFDAAPEWKDATISDCAIQIDDTLYYPGLSVADCIALVSASSIEYSYEYNPEKLLLPQDKESIIFYRDNIEWFTFSTANIYSDDSKFLSELPVLRISVSNECKKYCHYINGLSFDDILSLSYDDVRDLGNNTFIPSENYSYGEETQNSDNDTIKSTYHLWDTSMLENATWTGYEIRPEIYYTFYVDKNTSKVNDFILFPAGYSVYEIEIESTPLVSLSELSDDEFNSLVEDGISCVDESYTYKSISVNSVYLITALYNEDADHRLQIIFELTKDDGSKTYVNYTAKNLCKQVTGDIVFDSSFIEYYEYNDLTDAESTLTNISILDSRTN